MADGADEVLRGAGPRSNYATDQELAKRQSIFAFRDPALSRGGSPVERLVLRGDERVVDVGCGNGLWLSHMWDHAGWSAGLDLSAGMLDACRTALGEEVPLVQAVGERLPLATASVDGVLALHVLYHLDIPRALREVRRVLQPTGWLLATTNSAVPNEAQQLYRQCVEEVLGAGVGSLLPALPFNAENGAEILCHQFSTVEPAEHVAGFSVTDAEALIPTLDSVKALIEATIGRTVAWPSVYRNIIDRASGEITRYGAFRYRQRVTSFLCR